MQLSPWILIFCLSALAAAAPSKSTPDCAIPQQFPDTYEDGVALFWIQAVYLKYLPGIVVSLPFNPLYVDINVNPISDQPSRDGPVINRLTVYSRGGIGLDIFQLINGYLLFHNQAAVLWPTELTPTESPSLLPYDSGRFLLPPESPLFPGFNLVGFDADTRTPGLVAPQLVFSIVKQCTPTNDTELTLSAKRFAFSDEPETPELEFYGGLNEANYVVSIFTKSENYTQPSLDPRLVPIKLRIKPLPQFKFYDKRAHN